MEGDAVDRRAVVLDRLVRLGGQVHVEPADAPTLGADNQVVAAGVQREARDALNGALQLFEQALLNEVVHLRDG